MIQNWADSNGHTVVAWAEDIDVSGSIDPFDTPQLGRWLSDDHHREWDALAAWKLDRLGRNAIQLSKLLGWCEDNGKTLYSCSESLDLSNWAGRTLAGAVAGLAEGELEAIGDDGLPIQIADADDEWRLIQSVLDKNHEVRSGHKWTELSPLSAVVVCLTCGSNRRWDLSNGLGCSGVEERRDLLLRSGIRVSIRITTEGKRSGSN